MAFLSANERVALRTISQICYCNPFLPERIRHERALLGADFLAAEADWNMRGDDPNTPLVNAVRLTERIETLLQIVRERLARGSNTAAEELEIYEDAVFLLLYYRYESHFYELIIHALKQSAGHRVCRFYRAFQADWEYYFHLPFYLSHHTRCAACFCLFLSGAPDLSSHLPVPRPGNIRELEQCVRNVLIRQEYRPSHLPVHTAHETFTQAMSRGTLTADELLRRYCTLVYIQTGSYEETARRLQLDRRTVKSKIDPQFLAQCRQALTTHKLTDWLGEQQRKR